MLHSLPQTLTTAGLVDIDGTYVVQLILFIVFAVVFNAILLKPLMRAQEARHSRMAGARADAEAMDLRAADAFDGYQARIDEARRSAVAVRDEVTTEATAEALVSTTEARGTASETLNKGRTELAASRAEVEEASISEAESLAGLIADKILSGGQV